MEWQHKVEVVAETIPDEPELIHGDEVRSWREFDETLGR